MPGALKRSQALPEAPGSSQKHPGAGTMNFQLVLEALGGEVRRVWRPRWDPLNSTLSTIYGRFFGGGVGRAWRPRLGWDPLNQGFQRKGKAQGAKGKAHPC